MWSIDMHSDESGSGRRRIPAMTPALTKVYNGIWATGATSPASARDVRTLSRILHEPKKGLLHELHILEGKGVIGRQMSGHDELWYARR